MADTEEAHTPVLLHEVHGDIDPRPGETILDGTLGAGGHAEALCRAVGETGTVIGIDADRDAIARARETLRDCPSRLITVCTNARHLDAVLAEAGIEAVDAILLDLGLSSMQLADPARGFSFQHDAPLAMTFTASPDADTVTARDIVNEWSEAELENILSVFGEERWARRIARAIVTHRMKAPIERTGDLADLVARAVPRRFHPRRTHVATKTFQALRIVTNDEINALTEALEKGHSALAPGGRIAVISFHSIEDRIVKNTFSGWVDAGEGELRHKKPITPSPEERHRNPRARSAKLRTFIRTHL